MTAPTMNSPQAEAVLQRLLKNENAEGKTFTGMAGGPEGTFFFVKNVEQPSLPG